jgi:hypothetical protein
MANTKITSNVIADGAITESKLASGVGGVAGIVSNADATAITITSAENVGIGITSTDSHRLKIYGSGNGGRQLQIEGPSNNGLARFSNSESQDYSIGINDTKFIVYDDTADAYRMVVDSSGNVGIGTSSPATKLHVVTASTNQSRFAYNSTNYVEVNYDGFNVVGGSMVFENAGIERMRINSSGNMILNNTADLDASHIAIWQSTGKNGITLRAPNTAAYMAMQFQNSSGGRIGYIQYSNTGTSFSTTSDYRLKENVEYDWDATTRLKQLRPSRFNFIADPDTTVDGFIAHEVQDIVPEAITGVRDEMQEEEYEVTPAVLDEDGNVVTEAVMGTREVPKYQGIDQSKLVPLLVKTIQELEARITTLENA